MRGRGRAYAAVSQHVMINGPLHGQLILPIEAGAMTVNRFCASGLQSIALAAERIACGGADVPANMQWETIAEGKAKDKWERAGCR